MKVGDLVKHRRDARIPPLVGMVIEIASGQVLDQLRRVEWLGVEHQTWVSQKNLEKVSESR